MSDATKLEFRGSAGEYFRIWIVNLLLSIATLGIYSAWAKVRRKRYFYRSTLLDGHHFDYHANPIAILKGRLIAVPVLILYFASGYLMPGLDLAILVSIGVLLPWLIVRSHIFNNRNSSYRNLRFDFQPSYGDAYRVLLGYGLLTLATLGLAYPVFDLKRRELIVSNSGYGDSRFGFDGKARDLFIIYLKAGLLGVLILAVVLAVAFSIVSTAVAQEEPPQEVPVSVMLLSFIPTIIVLFAYIPIIAYTQSRVTNYTLSHTEIESHALTSELRARDLSWIYLTNILGIIFSVGLLVPWAAVRTARYRLQRTGMDVAGGLDAFVGQRVQPSSATGEELADIFDIDVGL